MTEEPLAKCDPSSSDCGHRGYLGSVGRSNHVVVRIKSRHTIFDPVCGRGNKVFHGPVRLIEVLNSSTD